MAEVLAVIWKLHHSWNFVFLLSLLWCYFCKCFEIL